MIKGVICFGLAVEASHEFEMTKGEHPKKIELFSEDMKSILHNCILAIVIVTTICCGSFMGLVRKCLLGDAKEEADAKAKELREIEEVAKKEYEQNHEQWDNFFGLEETTVKSEGADVDDKDAGAPEPALV